MKMFLRFFSAVIACSVSAITGSAYAEQVETKTIIKQQDVPGYQKVNFMEFDLNGDKQLSMEEVGEKLFYLFDIDNNEVIDNNEFQHRQIMTVIPMEKDTYTYVESGGQENVVNHTRETFNEQSHLAKFDGNNDGLSPDEFIERRFMDTDSDRSGVIEISEWEKSYLDSLKLTRSQQRYLND